MKHIIEQLEEFLIEAMIQRDVKVLNLLFHKDLEYVIPNGTTLDKDADLNNYIDKKISFYSIDVMDREIEETSNGFEVKAIVEIKGFFGRLPMDGHYLMRRVWVPFGNSFQIISGRSTWLEV